MKQPPFVLSRIKWSFFVCLLLLYFSLLTSQLLLSRILIISCIESNIPFLRFYYFSLIFWNVHNHLITREMTKKALKCGHTEQILSQASDQLLYSHQHMLWRSKGALRLWFLHGSTGRSRWRSLFHETWRGYHHSVIHSNHIQNVLWGFPHCRARRFCSDLWGALCLLMCRVWRATGGTAVEENELLWFPQPPSPFCKIQGTCLDVTKPH